MKKHLKYILFISYIILIIILLRRFSGFDVSDILTYSPESPLLAAFVIVGLYSLKSVVLLIPTVALYISAGVMFPVGWALAVTCAGLFCEMSIGYIIGKRLGSKKVEARIEKSARLKKFIARHNNAHLSGSFLFRFIPLNFELVSMFYGASGVAYPQYVLLSFLGTVPGMIPFVLLGGSLTTPFSKEFLVPFSICAFLCISVFFIYTKWNLHPEQK